MLDLAVPRDFDPEISRFNNVYLYSIDDLKEACQRNRAERDKQLPAALEIVEQETEFARLRETPAFAALVAGDGSEPVPGD